MRSNLIVVVALAVAVCTYTLLVSNYYFLSREQRQPYRQDGENSHSRSESRSHSNKKSNDRISAAAPTRTNLFVFTYTNTYYTFFCQLLSSALHFGMDVNVLGWSHSAYGGHMEKPSQLLNALEGKLPEFSHLDIRDDDLVLFVDAHDVFFVADKEEIIGKFQKIAADAVDKRFGMKTMFGSDKRCWPDGLCESLRNYPVSPFEYCCINTGVILGYKSNLIRLLRAWIEYHATRQTVDRDNDQVGAHVLYA